MTATSVSVGGRNRQIRMGRAQPNACQIPLPTIGSEPQVFTLARGQLWKSIAQLAEQLHNRADPGRVLSEMVMMSSSRV